MLQKKGGIANENPPRLKNAITYGAINNRFQLFVNGKEMCMSKRPSSTLVDEFQILAPTVSDFLNHGMARKNTEILNLGIFRVIPCLLWFINKVFRQRE